MPIKHNGERGAPETGVRRIGTTSASIKASASDIPLRTFSGRPSTSMVTTDVARDAGPTLNMKTRRFEVGHYRRLRASPNPIGNRASVLRRECDAGVASHEEGARAFGR